MKITVDGDGGRWWGGMYEVVVMVGQCICETQCGRGRGWGGVFVKCKTREGFGLKT